MWREFCAVVREEVTGTAAQQEFVRAAQSTFTVFEHWMKVSVPAL